MSKQLDNVIKKLNFKGLKLNMCTKKANYDKRIDYEFMPYESQPVEKPLSDLTNAGALLQSSVYLPSTTNQSQHRFEDNITAFRAIYTQLSSANLLASSLNQKNFDCSLPKMECMDLEPAMSSNEHDNYAYDNADYSSPFQSSSVSKATFQCPCCEGCSCAASICSFAKDSFTSQEMTSHVSDGNGGGNLSGLDALNDESYFDSENERLYVCCKAFRAKMDGDLSLRFTDRVKLIHKNDDIALVKNILNGKCGYVPRDCITTISEFLNEIQYFS